MEMPATGPKLLQQKDLVRHAVHLFRIFGVDELPVTGPDGRRLGVFTKSMLYEMVLSGRDLDLPVGNLISQAYGLEPPEVTLVERITAELEASRERCTALETTLNATADGLVLVNETGRIMMVNRALAGLLGCSPDELVGKDLTEVIKTPDLVSLAQTGGGAFGQTLVIRDTRCVLQGVPLLCDGRPAGAVGKVIFRDLSELRDLLQAAVSRERRAARPAAGRSHGAHYTFDQIVCESRAMEQVKAEARRAAMGDVPVLLLGSSGTGKELLAHAIHNAGGRRTFPFVKVNCAAVPGDLLESEFFGYEPGAFTGARGEGKPGKFELAHGGTLFLDEIGDMSLDLQSKLLRVLQDGEFERIGGIAPRKVDVRIIAATNRDLETMVGAGTFRADLYYRLNVLMIQIPPLAQRPDDIPGLVDLFIAKYNQEMGRRLKTVTPEAIRTLQEHNWPGNVRELENVIRRAIYLCDGEVLDLAHLPPSLAQLAPAIPSRQRSFEAEVQDAERESIRSALNAARGNRKQAAALLGISRATLYAKLHRLGLPTHKT